MQLSETIQAIFEENIEISYMTKMNRKNKQTNKRRLDKYIP